MSYSSNNVLPPLIEGLGVPEVASDVAIRVNNLSKCYQIYDSPRARLKQFIVPKLQRLAGRSPEQYFREFWALKDVSFEIKKGETVGIIGRNGSGKSTLLQIICGTLTPTAGSVETNGRIAALLELGSGFNPEFTGRENVYMNAAVLGLSKEEVDKRFDDIAAFADIGDFIEQPVKTYSSGMQVRLAFAVIAHVDPDILVVDEALAVGDAVFTQKCMRYIRRFQERGTLLFVSHDTGAVLSLCQKSVWLSKGVVQSTGNSNEVVESYLQYTLQETYGDQTILSSTRDTAGPQSTQPPSALLDYGAKVSTQDNQADANGWTTGVAEILSVTLDKLDMGLQGVFEGGERVRVTVRARAQQALNKPQIGFIVRDRLGQDLFGENTLPFTHLQPISVRDGQEFFAEFVFRLPMLPNGQYAVMASLADGDRHDNVQHHYLHNALILNVSSSKVRYGLTGIQFEEVSLRTSD